MKIQTKVLKELNDLGRESDVEELEINTEFNKGQLYEALRHLKDRGLIVKRKEIGEASNKNPPSKKIYVKIKEKEIKRIRKVIKNDRGN